MEEEKKKGREYYQVNLDTGRLFWMAFILGLILIGIFVLGFFVGGGKDSGRNGFFGLETSSLFKKSGRVEVQEPPVEEEIDIADLFESPLEDESYIDVKTIQTPEPETEVRDIPVEKAPDSGTEAPVKAVGTPSGPETVVKKSLPASTYRPVGDYFIQVASFEKKENADILEKRLEKNLYRVVVEEAPVEGKTFYRVQVGPFDKRSVAVNTMTAMKARLKLEGPFVFSKKNS